MTILNNPEIELNRPDDIIAVNNVKNDRDLRIPEEISFVNISIPVTQIGYNFFDQVEYENIYIPKTIRNIKWSFFLCKNLKNIFVDSENRNYCDIEGVLFSKDQSVLIAFPNARKGEYNIPNGTIRIENMAFKTSNISSIHIPPTVKKIGVNVFYGCKNLQDIYFDSMTNLNNIRIESQMGYGKRVNTICHIGNITCTLEEIANKG